MQMYIDSYVVIGSGPSGVMAASTLIEQGKKVIMLDAGITENKNTTIPADENFIYLRKNDFQQHKYFIGEEFEGIPSDKIKVGAQLTPTRSYMIKDTDKLIPVVSDNFTPMESLSCGGLGIGWGLGCYVYSNNELKLAGLDADSMGKAYQVISNRIRISGPDDDFCKLVLGNLYNIHPPLKYDNNISILIDKYKKNKNKFNSKGLYLGSPSLAMLSEDYANRYKTKYNDMDFYSDYGKSAWRPYITLEKLKKNSNFTYVGNILVTTIENTDNNQVKINYINIVDKSTGEIICSKLLLACGALGSARIVLRSAKGKIKRLPILCNPYSYMPCFNIKMLGKPLSYDKTSMAQAMLIYDTDGTETEIVSLAFYTYRSLMTFRMIEEVPLGIKDSIKLLKLLQSGFVIAGIHHPDFPSKNKYLELIDFPDSITSDALSAHYKLNSDEEKKIRKHEKTVKRYLRKLGCYPVKKLSPGAGGSIHYAGTLPFSQNEDEYGTTYPDGSLNGFKNIYIADGSGFKYLPAKGITFSLMANAHNVALNSTKNEQ